MGYKPFLIRLTNHSSGLEKAVVVHVKVSTRLKMTNSSLLSLVVRPIEA